MGRSGGVDGFTGGSRCQDEEAHRGLRVRRKKRDIGEIRCVRLKTVEMVALREESFGGRVVVNGWIAVS